MTNEVIAAKVKSILEKDFEVDVSTINDSTNLFTELDLDSIDAVDLVVRIQQETGKKVEPGDFREIRTFGDVVAAISKLVNG